MTPPNIELAIPLLSIVAIATLIDLRSRLIPNGLSLGGAAIGLLFNATLGGLPALELAVLGWICCLLLFIPFYIGGGMAAGDVKLMAAVGAFLGPVHGTVACVCTLVAGAALGSIVMVSRNLQHRRRDIHVAASASAASADSASISTALDKIPYAAAIALGATAAVLQPGWLRTALEGALS